MSISALSASNAQALISQTTKAAPDGDSPAVEVAESAATKRAENQNGGIAPKVQPVEEAGRVNKLV